MFLKNTFQTINKKIKSYLDPDHNPTDADKKAFQLLEIVEMEAFIQHFTKNNVNINVQLPFNGLNLLMKAVQIANKDNINGMSKQEILSRQKKIDINMQDKAGRTALLAACHWQQQQIVDVLIKHGADFNKATLQKGSIINPLLSASYKKNYNIMQKLIVAGADIDFVFELTKQPRGFTLQERQQQYLKKAKNVRLLLYAEFLQRKLQNRNKQILSPLSNSEYEEILDLC